MATKATLESELNKWTQEFREMGGAPDRLNAFLARRLTETGLVDDQSDWNVVRATVGGLGADARTRRIRITGWDGITKHLKYESAESGQYGFGICRVNQIVPDDNAKLADILDRLERGAR